MLILSRILVFVNKLFYFFVFLYNFFMAASQENSTKAPCEAARIHARHLRIEISVFVMRAFVFWLSAERSQPPRIHAIAGGQSTSARAFDASFTPTRAFCMSCPPPRGSYSSMRSLSMLNFSISFSTVIAARSSPTSSIATRPLFIKIVLLP